MPNLVGQEYRSATIQLKNLDLDLKFENTEDYSDSVTSGCIIKTVPASGETIQAGDTITLVISKGVEQKPVTVPTCTGFDIDTVRQNLVQLGLVCGEVQSVKANQTVPAGTTIDLVVSGGHTSSDRSKEPVAP